MISLGCAKNLVDAEIMLGSVLQRGMEITARAEDADVLVVNTCAFIDSAKEESIDAILEAHQQRGLNKAAESKADRKRVHGAKVFAASCTKLFLRWTRLLGWIKSARWGLSLNKLWRGSAILADTGTTLPRPAFRMPATISLPGDPVTSQITTHRALDLRRRTRLPEGCRRLQSPVQFLRDSANARKTSQPAGPISPR